jgi:YgiT-type zinc finger domain-containing protein
MICIICRQAEIVDGFTIVKLERGEFRLIVNGVPARVCLGCGEAYAEEVVMEQLFSFARQRQAAGILDSQCEYARSKFDTIAP